jgi:hypothetical protein
MKTRRDILRLLRADAPTLHELIGAVGQVVVLTAALADGHDPLCPCSACSCLAAAHLLFAHLQVLLGHAPPRR